LMPIFFVNWNCRLIFIWKRATSGCNWFQTNKVCLSHKTEH
jgi:hypothetical protein